MTIPPPYDYLDPRSIATPPFLPPGTATAQPPPPMRRARMEQLAMPPPRRRPPPPPLPAPPPEANVRELGQSPVIQDIHQERTRQREDPLGHYQRPPWWKQALGYAASSFRPTAGTDLPSRLIYGDPAMREMRAREETNRGLDAQQKAEQTAIDLGIAQGRERRATFDQGTQRMTADAASRRADVAGQVADTRAGELDFERSQPPPQPRAYKPGDYVPKGVVDELGQLPPSPPGPTPDYTLSPDQLRRSGTTHEVLGVGGARTAAPTAPTAPGAGPSKQEKDSASFRVRLYSTYRSTMEKARLNLYNAINSDAKDEAKQMALDAWGQVAEQARMDFEQQAGSLRELGYTIDPLSAEEMPTPPARRVEEPGAVFGSKWPNVRWEMVPSAGAGPPPMQAPPAAAVPPQIDSPQTRRGREHREAHPETDFGPLTDQEIGESLEEDGLAPATPATAPGPARDPLSGIPPHRGTPAPGWTKIQGQGPAWSEHGAYVPTHLAAPSHTAEEESLMFVPERPRPPTPPRIRPEVESLMFTQP